MFSVDPNTGHEKVLYAFCSQANCVDEATSGAGLIHVNGKLYSGNGCGAPFSIDPGAGAPFTQVLV